MRLLVPLALLAACSSPASGHDTSARDTAGPDAVSDVLALPPLAAVNTGRFATSPVCAECHSNAAGASAMRDAAGRPIAPFDLWQSSMMANSARDPLWRAAVSAEVAAVPSAGATIEAKCMQCHAPMAATDAALTGDAGVALSVLASGSERGHLGLDGVSCTACHQIEPTGFGTADSFSGGYAITGQGWIYGPHGEPFSMPMEMRSGFTPVESSHIRSSELCATCHQQELHTLAPDGSKTGHAVPEQAVFSEWRNSWAGAEGVTCQDCHLPLVDVDGGPIATRIARNPMGRDMGRLPDRAPYGRHLLVGGNTLIPQILRDQADLLKPQASAAAFNATLDAAREMLSQHTADLGVVDVVLDDGVLGFTLEIALRTGHRFPTGIPVRRAWLHVTVEDGQGRPVFTSGAWDGNGYLLDGSGVVLAGERVGGPVYPHRDRITGPDEVQVYEAVLAGVDGDPVWRLVLGASFYKDDRLLPRGWDPDHPEMSWMAPVGVGGDPDYADGGDRVRYELPIDEPGPFTVKAALVYQPLSTRWAEELFATGTPEALAFRELWSAADRTPERVAHAEVVVP